MRHVGVRARSVSPQHPSQVQDTNLFTPTSSLRDRVEKAKKNQTELEWLQTAYPPTMLHVFVILDEDHTAITGAWIFFHQDLQAFHEQEEVLVAAALPQAQAEIAHLCAQPGVTRGQYKNLHGGVRKRAQRLAVNNYPGFVWVDLTTPANYPLFISTLEEKLPTAYIYTKPEFETVVWEKAAQSQQDLVLSLTADHHLVVAPTSAVGPDLMFNEGVAELKMSNKPHVDSHPDRPWHHITLARTMPGQKKKAYWAGDKLAGLTQNNELLWYLISCFIFGVNGKYTHIISLQQMIDRKLVMPDSETPPTAARRWKQTSISLPDVEKMDSDEVYRKWVMEQPQLAWWENHRLDKAQRDASATQPTLIAATGLALDEDDTQAADTLAQMMSAAGGQQLEDVDMKEPDEVKVHE